MLFPGRTRKTRLKCWGTARGMKTKLEGEKLCVPNLRFQMYDVSYFEARGKHIPLGMYGGGEVDPQAERIESNSESGAW